MFVYKAINTRGDRIQGELNAETAQEVVEVIAARGYTPISIEEKKKSKDININLFNRIKLKDITIFCRQFYTMLNAGTPINTSLTILAQQATSKAFKAVLTEVDADVKKGITLSEAMKKHDSAFPDLLIDMVASGEATGNLDDVLEKMAVHFEKESKVKKKIIGAMIYPAILLLVTIVAVAYILTNVIPVFSNLFSENGAELPALTRFVLHVSDFLTNRWYILLLLIFVIVFGIRYYASTEQGQYTFSSMALKIPVIKTFRIKVEVARFTRTTATLLSSGIPLVKTLDIVADIVGNRIIRSKLLEVKESLSKGEGLYNPMVGTGLFPPMLTSMIKIGEESGNLDEILNKTADFYDEELDTAIHAMTTIIEPFMLVLMGGVIGVVVLSIYEPMFTMFNTIK